MDAIDPAQPVPNLKFLPGARSVSTHAQRNRNANRNIITALRARDEGALSLRRLTLGSPIWLSAVVLEELYAGIAPRGRHVLERFERDFENARRIPVPNLNDWTQSGKVLARLAAKYDYEKIGQAD